MKRNSKGQFVKGSSYIMSEEQKEKIRESNVKTYQNIRYKWQGENNPFFGKKHTQEVKDKIGLANKGNKAHWKGGITLQNKLERGRFRREMQFKIFVRDNFTCQRCDIKGGDLQIDHIQSWKDNIEKRFNIENCRTLCAKCHYRITFGRDMPETIKKWGHNLKLLEVIPQ